ncbi:hypothetical protein LB507_005263 [Fusarium sp. FIESC RH6]|nr:hypothetical protein LB507_005263 [Fusarium sp. FIESC RH6]
MCEGYMGVESWSMSILAPLRKEQIPLETNDWLGLFLEQVAVGDAVSSPKLFCILNDSFDAFHRLYRPSIDVHNAALVQLEQALKQPNRPDAESRLERLPSELIRDIHLYLEPVDVIALGLCSQRLWIRAVTTIHHDRRSYSWIDTPIFLTGFRKTTLPPAIYELYYQVKDQSMEEHNVDCDMMDPRNPCTHHESTGSWSAWKQSAMHGYTSLPPPELEYHQRRRIPDLLSSSGIPESLHEPLKSCLAFHDLDDEGQWYLRSLTTKQYIRMELVKDQTISELTTVSLTGNRWLTLDILLMWLINWQESDELPKAGPTRKPSDLVKNVFNNGSRVIESEIAQMRGYFMEMYTGKWAGHCLDVVKHAQSTMESGWTDITGEIEESSQRWFAGIYLEVYLVNDRDQKKYWDRFAKDQMEK